MRIYCFARRCTLTAMGLFLQVVFEQMRHVDVLDLVSLQCEPDSPDYIRVNIPTLFDSTRIKNLPLLTILQKNMLQYLSNQVQDIMLKNDLITVDNRC